MHWRVQKPQIISSKILMHLDIVFMVLNHTLRWYWLLLLFHNSTGSGKRFLPRNRSINWSIFEQINRLCWTFKYRTFMSDQQILQRINCNHEFNYFMFFLFFCLMRAIFDQSSIISGIASNNIVKHFNW